MPAPRLKHIYILCYYVGNQFPCDLSRNSFNLLVSLLHGYQEAHNPEKHCPCTDRESFRSVSEVLLQVTAGKQRPHTNIYRDLINQPCSALLIIDVHRIPFFLLVYLNDKKIIFCLEIRRYIFCDPLREAIR